MRNQGNVFLSHSHKDIIKVRRIRNELEAMGFEPICFYLKSFDDAETNLELRKELEHLLLRELEARDYFIYLSSESARNAYWVQWEKSMIGFFPNKKIYEINLEEPWYIQLGELVKIVPKLSVTLAYVTSDYKYIETLAEYLSETGMLVKKVDISQDTSLEIIKHDVQEGIIVLPVFTYNSVTAMGNDLIPNSSLLNIIEVLREAKARFAAICQMGCMNQYDIEWTNQHVKTINVGRNTDITIDDCKNIALEIHGMLFSDV